MWSLDSNSLKPIRTLPFILILLCDLSCSAVVCPFLVEVSYLFRPTLCRATRRTRLQISAPAFHPCPASTEGEGAGAGAITTAPPLAQPPPTAQTALWVRHLCAFVARSEAYQETIAFCERHTALLSLGEVTCVDGVPNSDAQLVSVTSMRCTQNSNPVGSSGNKRVCEIKLFWGSGHLKSKVEITAFHKLCVFVLYF